MALTGLDTESYASENFIESAGTVLFHLSSSRICLLRYVSKGEYLLAKGRRSVGESLRETALRETKEETGLECRLLPVDILSRATRPEDGPNVPDVPRTYHAVVEPFMLSIRDQGNGNIKLIWWFVAAVNETAPITNGEVDFIVEMFNFEEALKKVSYESDKETIERAICILNDSVAHKPSI